MKTPSKARLFLIEMVIIILFFAVAGAVCANIFVKAHLTSAKSVDLTSAALKAQYAAECLKNAKGDAKRLIALTDGELVGSVLSIYYDQNWNETNSSEKRYTLYMDMSENGGMLLAQIRVYSGEEEIYAIETGEYLGDG